MKWALAAVLVLAVIASASYPRLAALGGDARLMLNDYVEMWAYPGTIADYQFVTGGSDSPDNGDGWFGLVKNFDGTTLGVTVNHGDMLEVLYHPGAWGLIVGLDFDKATSPIPEESLTVTSKTMGFDAAWGTEIGLFGDYSDLAIGFGYDKSTIASGEDPEVGNSDLNFGASVRGHQDSFINLFPIISASVDMATELDGNDDIADEKTTAIAFDLGAGHNHMVAPKTTVIVGVYAGVASTSYSGEVGDNTDSEMAITIPRITGGIEQQIGKWIALRAGVTSDTEYQSAGDTNSFSTEYTTNFGLGFMWENFTLDATITEGFLHNGPYIIGGDANIGFLGLLAGTYTF